MGIEKRKFAGRAPRYNLKPFHNKIIKYTSERIGPHESTDFLDISASGLSFIASTEGAPDAGSIIKITFAVPGLDTLTIKAQVVRSTIYKRPEWYKRYYDENDKPIEEYFIAVHFLNIKKLDQDKLSVYLNQLIESEKLERKEQKISYFKNGLKNNYKWFTFVFITLAILTLSFKLFIK